MSQEMEFKNIVAQYSKVAPEEMTNEMRFREDLGFSSLDFMSFLGLRIHLILNLKKTR